MSIKPILFNTEMVRAILDGRKTVTRRIAKDVYPYSEYGALAAVINGEQKGPISEENIITLKSQYHPGDILYVRETWDRLEGWKIGDPAVSEVYFYRADGDLRPVSWRGKWHPSIHMPKEAARIWLKVTDVRVERLQDIDGMGILAEGIDNEKSNPSMGKRWENMQRMEFETLWNSTTKKSDLERYGWEANPYVFVIEFERIEAQ